MSAKIKHPNYLGRFDGQSRYSALVCGHPVRQPQTQNCVKCAPHYAPPKKQFCPRGHDTYITGRTQRGCRACRREKWTAWKRQTEYGISPEEFQELLDLQKGNCAICRKYFGDKLVIDHDHETGKFRKLLCSRCNTFLGYIEKSGFELLRNSLEYLSA